MKLSTEQSNAVFHEGNVFVEACPGSGKTRALTARLIRGITELSHPAHKSLAVTFTNRAAEEMRSRIEREGCYEEKKVWIGTIHSFCMEWVLRPYGIYSIHRREGYSIADEYETEKVIDRLKSEYGMNVFDPVNTGYDRGGKVYNGCIKAQQVERDYREFLCGKNKIDFDQILYFSFDILRTRPEIAETLGEIFQLICIDEVQDIQDLQYAILSKIYNHSRLKPQLFIVGDANQAIYSGIGGIPKPLSELNREFRSSNFERFRFSENYRSTQRVVDYFSYFRNQKDIKSQALYAKEHGDIVFSNKRVDKDDLPSHVAGIVQRKINSGVKASDICIIAPQWTHIRFFSRALAALLPHLSFDAPGLSPFARQQDNTWLTLTKLRLTQASGRLYLARIRWAIEVKDAFSEKFHMMERLSAKDILRVVNGFGSDIVVGMDYLEEFFDFFLQQLNLDISLDKNLMEARDIFLEKSRDRIKRYPDSYQDNICVFRNFFRERSGIVVNTCHGVKGEEYDVVIAFGLLRGYIPNWGDIIDCSTRDSIDAESKMMYVITSRAKNNLYLIAESGRRTQRGARYETSNIIGGYEYEYD